MSEVTVWIEIEGEQYEMECEYNYTPAEPQTMTEPPVAEEFDFQKLTCWDDEAEVVRDMSALLYFEVVTDLIVEQIKEGAE